VAEPFKATFDGSKKFEFRRNDRNFKVGDNILLKEWLPTLNECKPSGYTGRQIMLHVDYLMTAEDATFVGLGWENTSPIYKGYVIMSVTPVLSVTPENETK
jgi:hypothetical protein